MIVTAEFRDVAGMIFRRLIGFEGALVLLVDDDQSYMVKRGEDGGTRADDDARRSFGDALPGVDALPRRKPGVDEGDAAVGKARGEAADGLRGERDLGHQHEDGLAVGKHLLHEFQNDVGLAAAGDAVQQRGAGFIVAVEGGQFFERLVLLRLEGKIAVIVKSGAVDDIMSYCKELLPF